VVDADVLVTCPKPTHRIIHLRDWHWVDRDTLATEWAYDLGRSLPPEEVDLRYEDALLQVELVQRQLLTVLRCLVRHHVLRRVLAETVTAQGIDHFHEQVALLRKTDQGLARLLKQRAEVGGKVEDLDRELAELAHGHYRRELEFGVAGRLAIDPAADVLPLEDERLVAAPHPVGPDGTVRLDPAALEARHDAQVRVQPAIETVFPPTITAVVYGFVAGGGSRAGSSSMRAKKAGPPMAVGARPVSRMGPNSFHRSRVTTTQSVGTCSATRTAFQPVVFVPL
jgi:hypothetical protein